MLRNFLWYVIAHVVIGDRRHFYITHWAPPAFTYLGWDVKAEPFRAHKYGTTERTGEWERIEGYVTHVKITKLNEQAQTIPCVVSRNDVQTCRSLASLDILLAHVEVNAHIDARDLIETVEW